MTRCSTRFRWTRFAAVLAGVLLAAGPLLLAARPVQAATTFVVNQVTDQGDLNRNDGRCDVSAVAGDQCTLRAAIGQANASPGADRIEFDIPGGGLKSIRLNATLPDITQDVVIDGYTQPGASPNTLAKGTNAVLRIELDGSGIVTNQLVSGLVLRGRNVVLKGLAINRFYGNGVAVGLMAQGNRIVGCFIGTNANGTVDLGNRTIGILVQGADTVVGGTARADRNLVSGNGFDGVQIKGATNTRVLGNLIGTDKTATAALGNFGDGVASFNSSSNDVGANDAAWGNTIAYNDGAGVVVKGSGIRNRILGNAIFANGELGIDLGDDGPTPNDPGDADTGENRLQNAPVIAAATTSGNTTFVRGSLNSTPGNTFTIQIFSTPNGSEGKVFQGEVRVRTGVGGNADFVVRSDGAIPASHNVTATATSAEGDTSEFSLPVGVQGG